MEIKRLSEINGFLKAPAKAVEGALIYGRDAGLIRERSKSLEAAILGPKPDPFALIELEESSIKDSPGLLYAEAASIAMLGGRKFIRLRSGSEEAGNALRAYVVEREAGAPRGDNFFVIEAGELRKTSALRKTAEGSPFVVTIACYPDTEASLDDLVDEMVAAAGAKIENDAKAALLARLGGDRGISRQEIEKLLVFADAAPGKAAIIRREHVMEIVGDSGSTEMDHLIDAVFDGNLKATALMKARLTAEGTSPIRILRLVAIHLDRLAGAGGARGYNPYQAQTLQRHQSRWPVENIARAQGVVLDAETQCKTTGMPADEICERVLLALARGARNAPAG